MILTLTTLTTYEAVSCYKCGAQFALSSQFYTDRSADRGTWYCPNGHGQHFIGQTEAERLKAALDASRRIAHNERVRREMADRSRAAMQGVATKRAKQLARVAKGVCPCCNRSFADMLKHMAGQHPEFNPGGEA